MRMVFGDDIEIPETVPIMALGGTVLFPHAIVPLYIFEERYRNMLADVLADNRLFAIFNLTTDGEDQVEQLASVGTIGVVRAAHQNPDGTSNLALQGIQRVRLRRIVQETPYPVVEVEPYVDESVAADAGEAERAAMGGILSIIQSEPELSLNLPKEYIDFIASIEEPYCFLDVAAHAFCQCVEVRQQLLELLPATERFELLLAYLKKEQGRLQLFRQLQGRTRDEEIDLN